MKTQTLGFEKLPKWWQKILKKAGHYYLDSDGYPAFEWSSSDLMKVIEDELQQAGEVAVEEFVKVLKNTPYTTKTDNSTSGFIERVIEKANLLKE